MGKGFNTILSFLWWIILFAIAAYAIYMKLHSFSDNLTWRRSVKHFSAGTVDIAPIKQAIVNSPSSFGIQPYNVIIVENQEIKQKLKEACFEQAQVEECGHLFVFCAFSDVEKRMEEYLERTKLEFLRPIMAGFLEKCEDKLAWAKHQAYIALGFAMAAAAEKRIVSCPMEGFMPDKVSEILGLNETIVPCVMLAVGRGGDDNGLPPRFRFGEEELVYVV